MNLLWRFAIMFSLSQIASAEDCSFPSQKDSADTAKQLQRLNSLRNKMFSTAYTVDQKQLTFKFRLCDTPDPSPCTTTPPKYATVLGLGSDKPCPETLGLYNDSFISSGSNWVSLTFSGGDVGSPGLNSSSPQDSTITFICDPAIQENFVLASTNRGNKQQQQWHYSFVLTTNKLCEEASDGGLSAGSVFCIIFFTVAGVYFLFGFLYRRFVVRAKGIEQIPNYDMWKEFGNLVADGCDFVCRCGSRQEAKMYQGIGGDPMGNEESESEERDDRLLPM